MSIDTRKAEATSNTQQTTGHLMVTGIKPSPSGWMIETVERGWCWTSSAGHVITDADVTEITLLLADRTPLDVIASFNDQGTITSLNY